MADAEPLPPRHVLHRNQTPVVTTTFLFDEDSYSSVKERAEKRNAARSKAPADKSAFVTDNMAQFSLDAALRSPRSIHGRGGEGKAIFSDYMDVSIRKRVNLSAQGHA